MNIVKKSKYDGFLKVDEITYKNKKGKSVIREVMRRPNAVSALVYDTVKKKYILVSQWRPGPGNDIVEIVAGTMDKIGEDPRETMYREIEEEVGYSVDKMLLINEGFVSPGGNSELVSIYFAEVSNKIGQGGGVDDEDEEIEIIEMSRSELETTVFKDLKTIIAVQWAISNHKS
jgi:ADP-ribose pyrophosphatase